MRALLRKQGNLPRLTRSDNDPMPAAVHCPTMKRGAAARSVSIAMIMFPLTTCCVASIAFSI